MMFRTTVFALAAGTLAGLALPAVAAAQSDDDRGRHGFELMLRPGYGSAGGKSPLLYDPKPLVAFQNPPGPGEVFTGDAAPYGGGFAGDLSVGYRFLPLMSAGLYAEYRASSSSSVNDGTTDLSRTGWGSGAYVRGYLPMLHPKLDPYVSVGVGYMQDAQSYRRANLDWELTHHGVAVPLMAGVDYRILPNLALGPSFRYVVVSGAGGCMKLSATIAGLGSASNKQCTDADEFRRIVKAESYGVWSAGLDLRLTL
ncbi:MAG: outer membrane beta-barrel protein [Polyangiaceae bacterium]